MMFIVLLLTYISIFGFVLGVMPVDWDERPTLDTFGEVIIPEKKIKHRGPFYFLSQINRPICQGNIGERLSKDLLVAHVDIEPTEFILIKEVAIIIILLLFVPIADPDAKIFAVLIGFAGGWMVPEIWLKGRMRVIKNSLIKELPDVIDLLALCVNAGLDFMMSLKWVVEKSPKSLVIDEFNNLLNEINIGKTRKQAIRDLANKYQVSDLSTFSRTLIQADKMGTSVTEALNILSEDMRLSRFRRGQQMALKAPMKMLVPLLVFIFPVVGILIAGPILLDFIENNPFTTMR